MPALLYSTLVSWYRLVDPPQDHRDEALSYERALLGAIDGADGTARPTLLELGAGAGHNASHLKRRFRCTLTELSPQMSALSRELNPDCEHLLGDMRELRLDREFDAVLVHDAVMYMTSEDDLARAARTAFAHTRPGGAAVFAPDCVRETFAESTQLLRGEEGTRSLRGIEWRWDPDPADDTIQVEYVFLLRDGLDVETAHDRHLEGLFDRATWRRVLEGAGYRVELCDREDEGHIDQVFLCRRRRGG